MKTLLGTVLLEDIRGVLYICHYNRYSNKITVLNEILCTSTTEILYMYANIPNPESQVAIGSTYEELCSELEKLHKNMKDKEWLEDLGNCL